MKLSKTLINRHHKLEFTEVRTDHISQTLMLVDVG